MDTQQSFLEVWSEISEGEYFLKACMLDLPKSGRSKRRELTSSLPPSLPPSLFGVLWWQMHRRNMKPREVLLLETAIKNPRLSVESGARGSRGVSAAARKENGNGVRPRETERSRPRRED
ncbi:hypothetical protein GW17_00006796 [Ensete ventricosum]|nr:hypothetical protein GW17_00006796 [Ensete ventricosum]